MTPGAQSTAGVRARPGAQRAQRVFTTVMAAAVLAGIVAWAGWWGYKHVIWWTPAGHEIAGVVQGAAAVNENLLTPPQARRNVPITPAAMAALSRTAQQRLDGYYTGPLLASWRAIARRTLDPRQLHGGKDSAWMTWWRVDWVHLGELTLLPASSTATGTGTAEFRSNAGAINRVDYTWHLVDTRAGWRIAREDLAFEPGYGP